MPEVPSSSTTELAAQYASRVTADLKHNAAEQARINADLETLQKLLHSLRNDHAVLLNVQRALADTAATVTAAVPSQNSAAPRREATREAGAENPKKSESKKASPPSVSRPSLVDLVRCHLEQVSEPRSAAEITTALAQAHPDRTIKNTVVRTTVENLVAKRATDLFCRRFEAFTVTRVMVSRCVSCESTTPIPQ